MANNYEDITIHQGTDVAIELHLVKESDGTAFDLTNYSAAAKMKRRYGDSDNDPDTRTFIICFKTIILAVFRITVMYRTPRHYTVSMIISSEMVSIFVITP